ncbi:MAG: adenylosuccinate lyase [Chloroflexi bacterium]|nr:adenylosuccinate lyase [Chloroflexota bacterium]
MIERYSHPEMAGIWTTENKIAKWLQIEVAVCEAWARRGQIPEGALPKIRAASCDIQRMQELEAKTDHDVIAFLQATAETVGEDARHIHLGLTSSDIVDTGLSLQTVEAIDLLIRDVQQLIEALVPLALKHKNTVTIGRTHGVHAEPTTFGFKLALWIDEMRRNSQRLHQAREIMAVGKISGAVGTHANVPPDLEEEVCRKLGLQAAPVSTQIIQRDRHAQFMTTLAIVASSLEKFATEIRHLQRTEVREVEEPFGAEQQGSSAMPHKRNPIRTERICGLARVIRGFASTSLENISLWHERDISHSSAERIIFPDGCILLDYMLRLFVATIKGLQVYPSRMLRNLELTSGLIFSQRVLLALVEKGLDRQVAYKLVQRLSMQVWQEEADFITLLKKDDQIGKYLSQSELDQLFDHTYHLKHIDVTFQRLGLVASVDE